MRKEGKCEKKKLKTNWHWIVASERGGTSQSLSLSISETTKQVPSMKKKKLLIKKIAWEK